LEIYEVIQDVTAQYKGLDILKETTLHTEVKKNTIGQYSTEGKLISAFTNAVEAEKGSGVWQQNVLKCLRGERITAGGFVWKNI